MGGRVSGETIGSGAEGRATTQRKIQRDAQESSACVSYSRVLQTASFELFPFTVDCAVK